MKYRAVVVENEELSLSRLLRLLSERASEVDVVGQAMDGPSAVTVLAEQKPDLVFLDIQLPGMTGFEVLERVKLQPAVIFTTGFQEHAIEAFRTYAIDYLLKPIDGESLERALSKLRRIGFNQSDVSSALQHLLATSEARFVSRIPCRVGDRTLLMNTADILYFQSDNKYTSVVTADRELLIDTPLIDLERRLNPREFIRIHRSTIVNISWIAEIRRSFGKTAVLLRDAKERELPVGRVYAESLKSL
jgi:two-component system LytT family response regulator